MKSFVALLAFAAFFAVSPTQAEDKPDTPRTLSGGKVIGVEEAKKLADSRAAQFIDTRSPLNFGKGHVPGAKVAAYKEKSDFTPDFDASADKFDLDKLPADKAAKVVIYSDGPKGWKSYKAAVTAIKVGYKNVMWMRDGTTAWEAKGYAFE